MIYNKHVRHPAKLWVPQNKPKEVTCYVDK